MTGPAGGLVGASVAAPRSYGNRAADRARDWAPPVLLLVGGLVTWEVVVRTFGIKQFILPGPIAIAVAWQTYLPELIAAARYTVVEIVAGLIIGAGAGILVGAITARYRSMQDSLMPFAVAASSVPILAFAPLFNNWFGLDQQLSKAMVAAALCFFPVMINTVRGLTTVDPRSLELLRSYATSETEVFTKLRIPNALPYVFTALRLAVTLATIGAVVGEYFAAPRASLGQYIATYSAFLNFERSWAAIVFACAIGIGLYLVVVVVERIVMPWHDRRAAWS
jgi:NitT/TauT family transport system permease protein